MSRRCGERWSFRGRFQSGRKSHCATGYDSNGPAATLINVVDGAAVKRLVGNKCRAIGITFDPSGKELSIGNLDGNVVRWNLAPEKPVNTADCKGRYAYAGERSYSQDLIFSVRRTTADQFVMEDNDGKVLKSLKLNDSKLRSVVNSRVRTAIIGEYGAYHSYDLSSGAEKSFDSCGSTFDLSDDGKLFAQSCDGFKTSIRVRDLNSGKSWSLDGHPSMIHAVAYSPDFTLLAVAGNDGNAYLFDPKTRTLKKKLAGTGARPTALAFSFDGKLLITGDENGVLHRWNLSTATMLNEVTVTDRSDDIDKIEASVDGKNVLVLINSAAFLLDAELKVHGSLQTSDGYSSTSGNMTSTFSSVPIQAASFGSTGTRLVTAHPDGTVRFWDTSELRQIKKLKIADSVRFVATVDNPNVLTIATVGKKARFQLVASVSGKIIRQSAVFEASYLEKMVLSHDKRFAAVTDISGETVICNLDTMALRTLENRLSGYDSVAFSPNSQTFFIGG